MFHGLSASVGNELKQVHLFLQYLRLGVDHTHCTDLRREMEGGKGRETERDRGGGGGEGEGHGEGDRGGGGGDGEGHGERGLGR